ncbi:MAG: hypothetical protein WDZ31_13210 [Phycisphaeraceae bacterium]
MNARAFNAERPDACIDHRYTAPETFFGRKLQMFTQFTKMIGSTTLALGMTLGAGTAAQAESVLDIDINTITATYNDADLGPSPFSTNATGTIEFTKNSNSILAGMEIDHGSVGIPSSLLKDITGELNLINGVVQSGFINIEAWNDGTETTYGTYNADLSAASQAVDSGSSLDFFVFANSTGGFLDDTFAGVDVSTWQGTDYPGSIVTFRFRPNSQGVDNSTDTDVTVVVPTPAAALAGLPMLGVLGLAYAIRRRRMNAA